MLKIAVCDDEKNIVEKIKCDIFSYPEKCEIDGFYSGEELLLSQKNYDIIFLDIDMKGMNGIEVAKRLREEDKNVKIIYVTSYTDYVNYAFLLTFLVNRSEDKKVSRKKYWGIFLLPMFSLLFLYTLLSMGSIYLQFYGYGLFLLNVVALLFLNIYIIYLFYYVGKAGRLQNDLELQKQKSEMQFRYYEDLEEKYQSSRKLIHDMRNHLRAIEELYGNEDKEAKSYVEDLHQMLNKMGQTYYTDNRMLNIILNDKVKKAVQEGITVDVKIGNISLDGMKDVDITTIFANLLDNAIEAAVQADGEKFIAIQAERFHDFHIIKLTNTKGQECKKKGHMGIGLVNVRNALERYEGTMEIKEENEIYRTVIIIPQV